MPQYARTEIKSADLSTAFGLEWAIKLFGADVVAQVPLYQRGTRKGQPKGFVHWVKCTVGGWDRGRGGVLTPGLVEAWIGGRNAFSRDSYRLTIAGRIEAAHLPRAYLFEDGLQRLVAERAAAAAAHHAQCQEIIAEGQRQLQVQRDALAEVEKLLADPDQAPHHDNLSRLAGMFRAQIAKAEATIPKEEA